MRQKSGGKLDAPKDDEALRQGKTDSTLEGGRTTFDDDPIDDVEPIKGRTPLGTDPEQLGRAGPVKISNIKDIKDKPKDKPKSKPRKPRTIPFKDKTQLDPETQKKIDAVTPPFATKQGETGPLPVSMRNRRVPKTSSLAPPVETKPTKTDTGTNKIVSFKDFRDRVKTVTPDEVIPPKGDPLKVNKPQEGPTIDITPEPEKEIEKRGFRKLKPNEVEKFKSTKKGNVIVPFIKGDEPDTPEPETETETEVGGKGRGRGGKGKKPPTTGGFGKNFGKFMSFARKNPAVSLVGYDALRNLPKAVIPTIQGGRASIVQAKS